MEKVGRVQDLCADEDLAGNDRPDCMAVACGSQLVGSFVRVELIARGERSLGRVCALKIMHVTPYFAPAWAYGGPPRVVYELSRELVRRGHAVTVVTTDACDQRRRIPELHEVLDGIEVYRLRNVSNYLAWSGQAFLPTRIFSFFRRVPVPDVVHLHMFRTVLNIVARRFALRSNIPYLVSAHGSLPRIVRQRTLKRLFDWMDGSKLLRDASGLVALSGTEKADYESAGASGSKVSVISNGIDARLFEELPQPGAFSKSCGLDGKRLVTYVGRLNARKGLDGLLFAFHDIAHAEDDVRLVIAGPDDGYRYRLTKLAERLSVSDRVLFPGFLSPRRKLELLVDSDLVVYPAPREPFGLVPFEALLCGKPVVVSEDSGCAEILEEAKAALTVPPGDVGLLRDALLVGLRRDPSTFDMVSRGKTLITERLNWARIAGMVEQVYESVARPGRSVSS